MLEVYSKNVSVAAGAQVPLTDVALVKGKTAQLQGAGSIVLSANRCGVYKITVNASVTPAAEGNVSIQMEKNGILVDNAISYAVAAADSAVALSFTTLVPVQASNCECAIPTTLSFVSGTAATINNINVVVDKIV